MQAASPQIVHGDGKIEWSIEGGYPSEFQTLYDLYDIDDPVLYTFEGYWNEILEVYFAKLDNPTVRSRLFNISGVFQVICVTQEMNAYCHSVW